MDQCIVKQLRQWAHIVQVTGGQIYYLLIIWFHGKWQSNESVGFGISLMIFSSF